MTRFQPTMTPKNALPTRETRAAATTTAVVTTDAVVKKNRHRMGI